DGAADDAAPDGGAPYDAGPLGCLVPALSGDEATDRLEDPLGVATVTMPDRDACLRTYALASTAARREDRPSSPRAITEREGAPSVRTGHDLFDALHALAIEEARENAVAAVRDYAFDDGTPVPCGGESGCFETGRLWNYVWTRDTAYSVDLGLAALDPARSRGSLEFKLSERRGGGGIEVVQDTGTGGSWPVSSDRVAWALGAAELLPWLEEPARSDFRALALGALRGTIERDRRIVFDPDDGLYRGEQSFLDWREQTYPQWVSGALVHIAMSKTLSTNVLHLRAIEIAAELAEDEGDAASATRWRGWADALRTAIRARFWLEDEGLFSTFVTTELDPSPTRQFDLLGESLAILAGVADDAQADRILSTYPHLGPGAAPVIHPQQQGVRIYHNRGEWPFVTAYLLRAAREAQHDAAGDRAVHALMRGAALNLSNMENLETATGAPWVEDGAASGPVVNSERQLWSVAGYLAMVHHVVFGVDADEDGLRIRPWITAWMRETLFAGSSELVLRNLRWRGHALDVVVHLPAGTDAPGYRIGAITVDGVTIGDRAITEEDLAVHARIDVQLEAGEAGATELTTIEDPSAWRAVFGPRTPTITGVATEGARVRVTFDRGGEAAADVEISVYRDGTRVASALPGTTTTYLDEATDAATTTHCWSIETCFGATGTCSQHSAPSCWWGPAAERVRVLDASTFTATGGAPVTEHGRFHYQAWGDPGHRLEASGFTAPTTADYLLQVQYGNGGPTDTGITCAVKRVVVEDASTGAVVAEGTLVMPHMGGWDRWGESSFVRARLEGGRSYRFVIRDDDDTVNMSAFQHFATYTAGAGGRDGAFARVNIAELRILRLRP
ncbi:MAG: hypothetical protein M3Y87_35015, partial [Myxococcota bacterium]|nr:hypothetical protein [Myxococcota bacterium]